MTLEGPCVGASSLLLGPVDPSFRALSGRPKFTVRRHKLNKDYRACAVLSSMAAAAPRPVARLAVNLIRMPNKIYYALTNPPPD